MSQISTADQPEQLRFIAQRDGVQVGHIEYEVADEVLTLTHTIVPEEYAGQGVATAMARGVLDEIRSRGLKVVPECSFVAGWITKHPDYADLVATQA
ncbi:MAG TPA: GNAT family N-acetyltransferase [Marmoricola sp.]|nr:N-acetyltransferase [Nocardioidaceae bacterium]HMU37061.1 GNAT family N-acetyltransferase [Marmoricola sp.]